MSGTAVGVGVGTGVCIALGVGVGTGVCIALGVAFDLGTATPLFQTNLFTDLIHVYFLPEYVEVAPSFVQVAPAFTTAIALNGRLKIVTAINVVSAFFTVKE